MTTTRLSRLAAGALVGLLAAAGLGIAPAGAAAVPPDPPLLPPPPASALRIVDGCTLQIDWVAATTGEAARSYVVNLWSLPRVDNVYGIPVDLQQRVVQAPTTDYRWTGLLQNKRYNVTVSAHNAWGNSTDTVLGAIGPQTTPPPPSSCSTSGPPSPTRPFAAGDWNAVIVRYYRDFLGRPPTAGDLVAERDTILSGSPDDNTLRARRTDLAARLEAVAEASDGPAYRLYSAYFARDPEYAGLLFWSAKLRAGTSLRTVSAGFADSSEFRNTYGDEHDPNGKLRTHVFYCDPYYFWQKGSMEKNHEFIHQILPKNPSFNWLTPSYVDRMGSHVNSYSRVQLNDKSPLEVAEFLTEKQLFADLQQKLIHQ